MARPSSPRLKAVFENGSGEAVTAARAAVLPPCAAKAIAPPAAAVARSCSQGDKRRGRPVCQQRRYRNPDESVQRIPDQVEGRNLVGEKLDCEQRSADPDHPPTGQHFQRRRQCQHSQMRQQSQRRHRGVEVQSGGEAGRHHCRHESRLPVSSSGPGLSGCRARIDALGRVARPVIFGSGRKMPNEGRAKEKGRQVRRPFDLCESVYSVDSISNPQASSSGSGMYLEFLLRRAHSRRRVDRKY